MDQLDDDVISKISEFFFEQVPLPPCLMHLVPINYTCQALQLLAHGFLTTAFGSVPQHFDSPELVPRHFHVPQNVSYPEVLQRFSSLRTRGLRLHYWP